MTGTIQEKRNYYHIVLDFKDEGGKRKRKWKATGLIVKNNKRKAEKMLAEILAEYSGKSFVEPSKTLLCDYIRDWVRDSESKLQVTTYDVYVHMVYKHIYPYFRNIAVSMAHLTPALIQKYISDKLSEGLSANTVIKHFAVIRTAVQQAYKLKIVTENVCDFVEKPKRTKYYGEYYNSSEMKLLLACSENTPIETPVFLGAFFGLRRSEILGLKWDSVDFMDRTITIKHKVVLAKKGGKVTTHATSDLKTESSYRVLPLDDTLLAYLQDLKQKQDMNRKRNGNSHNQEFNDYICVNELGELISPDYVTHYFAKILNRNGLKKIRFHDLRHSCASLLLALGYSMKDIQEWLGHSNYQTTANLYSHVDPRNKADMIKGLANSLTG